MSRQATGKVTIRDIARATGLSTMTVSRVLNNSKSVTEDTRKRVLAVTKRLNYHVDFIARQLRAKHTFEVGVVAPFQGFVGQFYFGQVLQGIQKVLSGTEYHIALFDSLSEGFDDPQKCVNLCHERRVGGLIVVAPGLRHRFPKTFANLKMPLIVVGTSFGKSISYVDVDNFGGAVEMTEHLIGLGHRKIGFMKGRGDQHDAAERELGFRKTMTRHRVPIEDRWIVAGDYEMRRAFQLSLNFLSKSDRPTAVFAANDQMAYGVIEAARVLGIRVPEDLSVGGFDDVEGAAEFMPALTTVAQPMMDLGTVATRYLLDTLDKPDPPGVLRQKLRAELVVRSSTARPGADPEGPTAGFNQLPASRSTRLN